MIFVLPALLCAISAGAFYGMQIAINHHTPALTRRATPLIVGGLLLAWFGAQWWGIVLYNKYPPHGVDGLRDLAAVLTVESTPNDTILVMPPILTPPIQQYFTRSVHGLPSDFDLRAIYLPFGDADWNARARATLDSRVQGYSRFWLIYYPADDFNGDFLRGVGSTYDQLEYHHYQFADLYLFR
jgi:hypothetical protein